MAAMAASRRPRFATCSGLSDRGEVIALFERVDEGRDRRGARDRCDALHQAGADAADILIELAEFCHFVTRAKIAPARDRGSGGERDRASNAAANSPSKLTLGVLARAWQILLKGVEDVKDSPRPLASAEMALIRLAYASDLPTPEEALRKLGQAARRPAARARRSPSRRRGPARFDAARGADAAPPRPRPSPPAAAAAPRPSARAFRRRRRARAHQARHSACPGA